MLCSKCSEPVNPVIAVDIDGTLGDYHGHFISFAEMWTGKKLIHGYSGKPGFREWFRDANGIDTEEYRAIKLAYRQGGMKRSMPIFNGARQLCRNIKALGAELWVTTTRPYLSLDNIVPDTVEWLRRHKIKYDGMLFDEDKYEQLALRVDPERVILVVDDLVEMCDAADVVFGRDVSVMMANDYNYAYTSYRRSGIWEVIAGVEPLIRKWREVYDAALC